MAVRRSPHSARYQLNAAPFEHLITEVSKGTHKIIIGGAYISPFSAPQRYEAHIAQVIELAELHPRHEIVLVGDYNLPGVKSIQDEDGVSCDPFGADTIVKEKAGILRIGCSFLGFNQSCTSVNSLGDILDLVFAENQFETSAATDPLLEEDEDFHTALQFEIPYVTREEMTTGSIDYDFWRADMHGLRERVRETDWPNLLQDQSFEGGATTFYLSLKAAMENFIPKKRIVPFGGPPPMTWRLILRINGKKLAHQTYKCIGQQLDYDSLKALRAECKRKTEESYNQSIGNIEDGITTNTKAFWMYVSQRRCDRGLSTMLSLDGRRAKSGSNAVNLFTDFFESVYTEHQAGSALVPRVTSPVAVSAVYFTIEEVRKKLCELDQRRAQGRTVSHLLC